MPMDPEKIRENMRRLSRIGEPGSPGGPAREARSGSAKPLWEPLPGDDLKDIEAEQEKLKRLRSSSAQPPAPNDQTRVGPRGGRYRINSNGRKSYDVP